MKVILKGINPQVYANPINDSFTKLLQELTFPIETDCYRGSIFFEDVVKDVVMINNEEWGLLWFEYEEIKEVKD